MSDKVTEYITYDTNPSNYYILNLEASNNKQHTSNRVQTLYELSIPTCSYRMGVPNMGYGMLTITRSGKAYVSILWLPSRYTSIYYYLIFLCLSSAYLTFGLVYSRVVRFVFRYFRYFDTKQ